MFRNRFALVLALALVAGWIRVQAQSGLGPNGQAVDAYVSGRIAAGEMTQGDAEAAIARAYSNGSLSKGEFDDLTDRVRKEFERLRKERREQNPVFTADWPLGSLFMGYDYKTTLDVSNGCKTPQTATITYPAGLYLSGPATVDVPANSVVNVPLKIGLGALQIPPNQPIPIALPPCPILEGLLTVEHPKAGRCQAMKRTYSVSLQLHLHGPNPGKGGGPDPGGGGGGGGKPKEDNCKTLWDRGEFFPTKEKPTPDACQNDLRASAIDFLDTTIAQARQMFPGAWDWMPTREQIQQMSPSEILDLRRQATDLLRQKFEGPSVKPAGQ